MAMALWVSWLVVVASSLVSVADDPWCVYEPPAEIDRNKHIVLISGDEEYRSEEALPMLGKLLSQRHGFRCTVLFPIDPESGLINPDCVSNIPGMEALDSADLVIMALRYRYLPDEQMQHFVRYLERGGPLIALRTSTHAFNYPNDSNSPYAWFGQSRPEYPGGFGKQVVGETWVAHHGRHGRESTRGIVNAELADHPILKGVRDVWGPSDVYRVGPLPEDAKVLMYGQILSGMTPDDSAVEDARNDPMMPLVWARQFPGLAGQPNRVVCTTMGAATDFQSEGLRRLIVNASYWLLGLESRIDPLSDVEPVGDYRPTGFGFKQFQPGKTPRDHDLQVGND